MRGRLLKRSEWRHVWRAREVFLEDSAHASLQWVGAQTATHQIPIQASTTSLLFGEVLVVRYGKRQVKFRAIEGEPSLQQWLEAIESVRQRSRLDDEGDNQLVPYQPTGLDLPPDWQGTGQEIPLEFHLDGDPVGIAFHQEHPEHHARKQRPTLRAVVSAQRLVSAVTPPLLGTVLHPRLPHLDSGTHHLRLRRGLREHRAHSAVCRIQAVQLVAVRAVRQLDLKAVVR